uniref:Uncharacterized protein n=1 Tax=Rhizophora mucronata TaxID=61149 RepID=A0A2P2IQV2_RHIMU
MELLAGLNQHGKIASMVVLIKQSDLATGSKWDPFRCIKI